MSLHLRENTRCVYCALIETGWLRTSAMLTTICVLTAILLRTLLNLLLGLLRSQYGHMDTSP